MVHYIYMYFIKKDFKKIFLFLLTVIRWFYVGQ